MSKNGPEATEAAAASKIEWDDSEMTSTYANVCNAVGTREEVVLFFGVTNPARTEGAEVSVQLSDRIILSPFAAKRLAGMLSNVLSQYEQRWGSLEQAEGQQIPAAND